MPFNSDELVGRVVVLLDEHLFLLLGEPSHVGFPARAEVRVPPPQTAQDGLGFLVILGAKSAVSTFGIGHDVPRLFPNFVLFQDGQNILVCRQELLGGESSFHD